MYNNIIEQCLLNERKTTVVANIETIKTELSIINSKSIAGQCLLKELRDAQEELQSIVKLQ
jgi:hypothetical protein